MLPSKRKRSPATLRPPPTTPRTTKPRPTFEARTTAPFDFQRSSIHPSLSTARQLQTPFWTETEHEAAYSESSIDDDLGHVIVAFDIKDYGTVGCAYYSADHEKMYLLGDSRSGGMETIDTCMFSEIRWYSRALTSCQVIAQIKPTVILTPPRVDISSIQGQSQHMPHGNGTFMTFALTSFSY
jgi:DNA mismatch repair protein MSH5